MLLLEELKLLFEEPSQQQFRGFDADEYTTVEKGQGRVEKRTYYSL